MKRCSGVSPYDYRNLWYDISQHAAVHKDNDDDDDSCGNPKVEELYKQRTKGEADG